MRVVKPRDLGILHRFYEHQRRYYLSVAALACFPFEQPRALFPEQQMWRFVMGQLGKQVPLDEGMPKPRGEFLVAGACFAPGGRPAETVEVEVRVGPLVKRLLVFGDRVWLKSSDHFDHLVGNSWVMSDPEPFSEKPLTWDRAFGGPEFPQNPLGKGFIDPNQQPEAGVSPLPNLEDPEQLMAGPWAVPRPACFMPLDISWPQRSQKAGTYDRAWLKQFFPGYAPDLDRGLFNQAPEDQQLEGFWAGNEEFQVRGMHRDKEKVEGRLPGLRTRAFVLIPGEQEEFSEIEMHPDTVWLFPGQERGVVIHRGVREVAHWDGREIRTLVLAYEYAGGRSREAADYRLSLSRRSNRKEAVLWALRQDDLQPPEGVPRPREVKLPPPPPPPGTEAVEKKVAEMQKQARQAAQQGIDKFKAICARFKVDPAKYLPKKGNPFAGPVSMPSPPSLPRLTGPQDLPALMEFLGQQVPDFKARSAAMKKDARSQVEKARREMERHRAKAQELLQKQCRKFKVDYQKVLQQAKSPEVAKQDLAGPLQKLQDQLEKAGNRVPGAEGRARLGEVRSRLDQGIAQAKKMQGQVEKAQAQAKKIMDKMAAASAQGAHVLPPPELKPPPEREKTAAQALAAAAAGRSLAGWDLAGVDLRGADLAGVDLKGAMLDSADLSRADLSRADLSRAVLVRARLEGAKLAGAKLAGANLGRSRAAGADFSGAHMEKVVLEEADLAGAVLAGVVLGKALVRKAHLAGADLSGVQARQGLFMDCDFTGARLQDADFSRALFNRARLDRADFSRAKLEKATFVKSRARGARFDQARMPGVRLALEADFQGASFRRAQAPRSNWRQSNLEGADFSGAVLDGGDFGRCRLAGAVFFRVSARRTQFSSCDLTGAVLAGSDLLQGSLMYSHLEDTDLSLANLFNLNFMGVEWGPGVKLDGSNLGRTLLEDKGEEQ